MSKRKGFTLVELLVVIGIIAVLIGVLLPALNKRPKGCKVGGMPEQLRQLDLAFISYSIANKGTTLGYAYQTARPATADIPNVSGIPWIDQLAPYLKTSFNGKAAGVWAFCPEAPFPKSASATASGTGTEGFNQIASGSNTVPISGSYGINIYMCSQYLPATTTASADLAGKIWHKLSTGPNANVPIFCDSVWVDIIGDNTGNPPDNFNTGTLAGVLSSGINRACIDRHSTRVNVCFKDGSAQSMKLAELWNLQWSRTSSPRAANVLSLFPSQYR